MWDAPSICSPSPTVCQTLLPVRRQPRHHVAAVVAKILWFGCEKLPFETMKRRSRGRSTGNGRSSAVLSSIKMEAFEPMPNVSDTTAKMVKAGLFTNIHAA